MKISDNNTHMYKTEILPEDFDDVAVSGCTSAHIEKMSQKEVWIGLNNEFSNERQTIHIRVWAKSKIKVSIRDD